MLVPGAVQPARELWACPGRQLAASCSSPRLCHHRCSLLLVESTAFLSSLPAFLSGVLTERVSVFCGMKVKVGEWVSRQIDKRMGKTCLEDSERSGICWGDIIHKLGAVARDRGFMIPGWGPFCR